MESFAFLNIINSISTEIQPKCHIQYYFSLKSLKGSLQTPAKLIEIQKSLQRRHNIHETGGQVESNDTLCRYGVTAHWTLRPKCQNWVP